MNLLKCLLLVVATMFFSSVNAQELKKTVLGIGKFSYSQPFTREDSYMIRNQIVKAIQSTGRVIVVDHDSSIDSNLRAEAERRKQESAMDANTVADMGTLNSNSILSVSIDQLLITEEIYEEYKDVKTSNGRYKRVLAGRYPYILASLTYTVKITDCETGMVQAQRNFQKYSGGYQRSAHKSVYATELEAHQGIMRHCVDADEFKLLILNTFKAKGKILQIEEGNAKKAKTVYINMGSSDGIKEGQILEVFKEVDIAGETSRKLVGEVEVREIMGDSRCLAKVKKGGAVILQVMSNGGCLPVESRNVEVGFWGIKY